MMNNNLLQIDKSILRNYDIKLSEFMFMLILMYYPSTRITIDVSNLLENGFIIENDVGYCITESGLEFVEEIETASTKVTKEERITSKRIESLAEQLRALFPEGKKPGTTKYWRDNKSNVEAKLKTFLKKYGNFDDELILRATQKYISSFGDNKQLMRTSIYMIEKDGSSDLMTAIENIDELEVNQTNNWTSELV